MDWKMEEENEVTHDPRSFKRTKAARNTSYIRMAANEPSAPKQLKQEVKIRDEFVEVKLDDGQSMFIFAIDEHGLPYFPVKGKLPLYVTELGQRTIPSQAVVR